MITNNNVNNNEKRAFDLNRTDDNGLSHALH